MRWTYFIWVVLTLFGTDWAHAISGITYHGRLLKPDGSPVLESNVQFRLQIRSPGSEDCLLYEEIQSADLSNSKGTFAVSLGDSTGVRQDSNPWNLFDAFSNRTDFSFSGVTCSAGTTYSPNPTDNRRFRVFFNDGTFAPGTWEALPLQTLNFIPMSVESYAVGGYPASSLLRVENAGALGSVNPISSTQLTELLALIGGTSTQYSSPNELNGFSLPPIGTGQSVRWSGSAWEAYTPTNASLPTFPSTDGDAGQVLSTNGSGVLSWMTPVKVNATGAVGIGTATPAGALDVYKNTNASVDMNLSNPNPGPNAAMNLAFTNDSGLVGVVGIASSNYFQTVYRNRLIVDSVNGAGLALASTNAASGDITFHTAGDNTRMLITHGGNVGIGEMTPITALHVRGSIQFGDNAEPCSAVAHAGRLRYNSGVTSFCNGSSWRALAVSGPGSDIVADTVTLANGIKIGSVATACNTATEGTIRYNFTSKAMEFCNGSAWTSF